MKNPIKAYRELKEKVAARDIEISYSMINGEMESQNLNKIEKFHDHFKHFFPNLYRIYLYLWFCIGIHYLMVSLMFLPFAFIMPDRYLLWIVLKIELCIALIIFIKNEVHRIIKIYREEKDRNGRVSLGNIFRKFTE